MTQDEPVVAVVGLGTIGCGIAVSVLPADLALRVTDADAPVHRGRSGAPARTRGPSRRRRPAAGIGAGAAGSGRLRRKPGAHLHTGGGGDRSGVEVVANRLQLALFMEALRCVDTGLATTEQVDTVVRSTFRVRLPVFGPFAVADMAGLDVYCSIRQTLAESYGKPFDVPDSP